MGRPGDIRRQQVKARWDAERQRRAQEQPAQPVEQPVEQPAAPEPPK